MIRFFWVSIFARCETERGSGSAAASMVGAESGDEGAALAEPPDPDVVETDPTCRYIRVIGDMVFSLLSCFLSLVTNII